MILAQRFSTVPSGYAPHEVDGFLQRLAGLADRPEPEVHLAERKAAEVLRAAEREARDVLEAAAREGRRRLEAVDATLADPAGGRRTRAGRRRSRPGPDRARLLALHLALSGTSRTEAARRLEQLGAEGVEALLEDAYVKAGAVA